MKLCMDTPVHHVRVTKMEHRSKVKVKVTENINTTVWAITFASEDVETSGRFHNVPDQNTYRFCVTWRQIKHDLCIFYNFVNFVPIDLKIGNVLHTLIGPMLCNIYKIEPIKIT